MTREAAPTLKRRSQPCMLVVDGDRIAFRHGATTTLVNRDDIIMARSERNVTRIVTHDGEVRIREPFHVAVDRLRQIGIMRVHRCVAVNPRKVRELVGRGQHRLIMVLSDGRSLGVGREYQPAVKRQFGASRRRDGTSSDKS